MRQALSKANRKLSQSEAECNDLRLQLRDADERIKDLVCSSLFAIASNPLKQRKNDQLQSGMTVQPVDKTLEVRAHFLIHTQPANPLEAPQIRTSKL